MTVQEQIDSIQRALDRSPQQNDYFFLNGRMPKEMIQHFESKGWKLTFCDGNKGKRVKGYRFLRINRQPSKE